MELFRESVIVDTSGAGDNVPKVDAKIRRIKELYHSVKNGLPWELPKAMVKDLVAYAVARLNICRTTALTENVCPKVLFTGVKINYKKELELAFGDYCEVYHDGTDNTSAGRSIPCFTLYPTNNSMGSWEFMNLTTKVRVRRLEWKLMVTTKIIINVMNHVDKKCQPELLQEPTQEQRQPEAVVEGLTEQEQIQEQVDENEVENEKEVPDLVDSPDSDSEDDSDDEEEPELGVASRTRSQTGTDINPPTRYTMVVKVNKKNETPERRQVIEQADKDEIDLLFVQL